MDAWFKPTGFSQFNVILCKPYTQAPWVAPYLSYMMRLNTSGSIYEVSTNNNNYIYTLKYYKENFESRILPLLPKLNNLEIHQEWIEILQESKNYLLDTKPSDQQTQLFNEVL